jgi:hypothetical protein
MVIQQTEAQYSADMRMSGAGRRPALGGQRGKVCCECCGSGRSLGGRALPQTRRIATAAKAAITSNSVRSGRFIGLDFLGLS